MVVEKVKRNRAGVINILCSIFNAHSRAVEEDSFLLYYGKLHDMVEKKRTDTK